MTEVWYFMKQMFVVNVDSTYPIILSVSVSTYISMACVLHSTHLDQVCVNNNNWSLYLQVGIHIGVAVDKLEDSLQLAVVDTAVAGVGNLLVEGTGVDSLNQQYNNCCW